MQKAVIVAVTYLAQVNVKRGQGFCTLKATVEDAKRLTAFLLGESVTSFFAPSLLFVRPFVVLYYPLHV